jgi:hypothetical protein
VVVEGVVVVVVFVVVVLVVGTLLPSFVLDGNVTVALGTNWARAGMSRPTLTVSAIMMFCSIEILRCF